MKLNEGNFEAEVVWCIFTSIGVKKFKTCSTLTSFKKKYERFWSHLNLIVKQKLPYLMRSYENSPKLRIMVINSQFQFFF